MEKSPRQTRSKKGANRTEPSSIVTRSQTVRRAAMWKSLTDFLTNEFLLLYATISLIEGGVMVYYSRGICLRNKELMELPSFWIYVVSVHVLSVALSGVTPPSHYSTTWLFLSFAQASVFVSYIFNIVLCEDILSGMT